MKTILLASLFLSVIIDNSVSCAQVDGPSDMYISSLGENVTLTCTVYDHTTGDINWLRIEPSDPNKGGGIFCLVDNNAMEVDCFIQSQYKNFVSKFVPGKYDIEIQRIEENDLGEYTCYYSSPPTRGAVVVLAELPDSIEISGSSRGVVEVIEGLAHTLTCTASNSKPQVSIQWTIGGDSVPEDSSDYTENSNGYFTTTSIMNETYYHEIHQNVSVECIANNTAGTTEPTTVKLNVLVGPANLTISNGKEDYATGSEVILINGTEHTFDCVARGANPAATITWHLNGAEVTDQASSTTSDSLYDTISTLTFTFTDEGNLICRATNPANEDEIDIFVKLTFIYSAMGGLQVWALMLIYLSGDISLIFASGILLYYCGYRCHTCEELANKSSEPKFRRTNGCLKVHSHSVSLEAALTIANLLTIGNA